MLRFKMWLMLMVIGKRRDEEDGKHETRKIIIQINSSRGRNLEFLSKEDEMRDAEGALVIALT